MNDLFSLDNNGELVAKITGDDLTDAYKTVTLDCQNTTIDGDTKTFYISVPAQEYGKLVINVTGNSVTKTMTATASTISMSRNKIYPITFAETLYVDLGLPSHTLWAKKNIGAGSPTDQGLYYAWGDTRGYAADAFDPDDDEYYDFEEYSDYLFEKYDEDGGTWEGSNIDPQDDTATKLWGSKWCMPTITQFEELVNPTNTTITAQGNGWLITSNTNGNSIYLPNTGYFDDEDKSPSESGICWLWTSDWWSEDEYAWAESFFIKNENNAVEKGTHNKYLEIAMPIRPVMKKQTSE